MISSSRPIGKKRSLTDLASAEQVTRAFDDALDKRGVSVAFTLDLVGRKVTLWVDRQAARAFSAVEAAFEELNRLHGPFEKRVEYLGDPSTTPGSQGSADSFGDRGGKVLKRRSPHRGPMKGDANALRRELADRLAERNIRTPFLLDVEKSHLTVRVTPDLDNPEKMKSIAEAIVGFDSKNGRIGVTYDYGATGEADQDWVNDPAASAAFPALSKAQLQRANQALERLERMEGLEEVKQSMRELKASLFLGAVKQARGLPTPPKTLHAVFSGNPGTGKTTVARLYADILKELGFLRTGAFVEVSRGSLVGDKWGAGPKALRAKVDQARGGVLLIDEVYALKTAPDDALGQEVLDDLVKLMEDHRDDLIVICAGYADKMEGFLAANPGLKGRFGQFIEFKDYSDQSLERIMGQMANEMGLVIPRPLVEEAVRQISAQREQPNFSNARAVRNMLERAVARQELRLLEGIEAAVEAGAEVVDFDSLLPSTEKLARLQRSDLLDQAAPEMAEKVSTLPRIGFGAPRA